MLVFMYEKVFPASMVSHIDTVRVMNRIIRRSGLEVGYSKGFNPHMEIFFSPALSLGVNSTCEMIAVSYADNNSGNRTQADKKEKSKNQLEENTENRLTQEQLVCIINKLNSVSVDGIRFIDVWQCEKNPNFAAVVNYAKYSFEYAGLGDVDFTDIFESNEYEIEYKEKGLLVRKDVRKLIKSVKRINENRIEAIIACGNTNLKADRFIYGVMKNKGYSDIIISINKVAMFDCKRKNIVESL